ncbi:MAG TPA: TonB family protein [Myxococcota bacterium]|jgi:protein TonB
MTARAYAAALLMLLAAGPASSDGPSSQHEARAPAVDLAPTGPSVESRLAEIRRRIQAALEYPPIARWQDLQGDALVRFEIGAEGRARDVRVVRSSGVPLLDAAAARAVVAAGELPRVYGPLEVPVSFELATR